MTYFSQLEVKTDHLVVLEDSVLNESSAIDEVFARKLKEVEIYLWYILTIAEGEYTSKSITTARDFRLDDSGTTGADRREDHKLGEKNRCSGQKNSE